MKPLPISACFIVCNEEDFISHALQSAATFASEILVADSGSSDGTLEKIAEFKKSFPATKLWQTKWEDDFSKARNELASHATQDWILFLDGDEIVESTHLPFLERVTQSNELGCFAIIQRNYTDRLDTEGSIRLSEDQRPDLLKSDTREFCYFENWMDRFYRRDLGLQYVGRIHENLIQDCQAKKIPYSRLPVVLHHYGRLKQTASDKYLYYLELTRKKFEEQPDNPAVWIELMVNLTELEQFDAAFQIASKAVREFPAEPLIFKTAYQAALRAGEFKSAEDWIRHCLSFNPEDLYTQAQLSTALVYQKKFRETIAVAQEIFHRDPDNFVAHVNCAIIFFEYQDWKNAARHISQALRMRPDDRFLQDAMKKIPAEFQIH